MKVSCQTLIFETDIKYNLILDDYTPAPVDDVAVQKMASFATKVLSQRNNAMSPLVMTSVLSAEKQIADGIKYRLRLEFKGGSKEKLMYCTVVVVFDEAPAEGSLPKLNESDCVDWEQTQGCKLKSKETEDQRQEFF